ncbi:MAG: META domain-containing protein [Alistipes sp.]|nr:META domain-containing protein [Alistipes sp.]
MKRTFLFSLALSMSALLLVGCCDCRKSRKLVRPLQGTEWQLIQIMAREITPADDSFTLMFHSDGTMTGVGDCNRLSATYHTTEKRDLSIENIGSTRRLCPNQEAENEFLDMLDEVTHYEMDADIMLLLSKGRLVGMMKALPAK